MVVGCDVAKHTDWTVLIAMEARTGRCLAMERFNRLDWPVQRERIAGFVKKWRGRLVMDATGVGDPVFDDLRRELPDAACTGIMFDNGKEFARHAEIAAVLAADVFFARPYHSWERGTNENTNGLIRRLFPKSESFAAIGEAGLLRIDRFLNDRPRKCLGWATPREVMDAFLAGSAPAAA